MTTYSQDFFAGHHAGSLSSARAVVPMIRELVRFNSVVDVGCGDGCWLSVFIETGTPAADVLGLDGPWVKPESLSIPRERFVSADLAAPPALGRRFDLAVSVEVAEHLPDSAADGFVQTLTSAAPVVVFSAAIPDQGGTHHINERWPDYWAAKFDARGYGWADPFRTRLWTNPGVQWWYAQNLLVFADRSRLDEQPALKPLLNAPGTRPLPLVHPGCFAVNLKRPVGLSTLARETPRALKRAIKSRLRGK